MWTVLSLETDANKQSYICFVFSSGGLGGAESKSESRAEFTETFSQQGQTLLFSVRLCVLLYPHTVLHNV